MYVTEALEFCQPDIPHAVQPSQQFVKIAYMHILPKSEPVRLEEPAGPAPQHTLHLSAYFRLEIVGAYFDAEGDIDKSEVSDELWEDLASADMDGNESLSSEELSALVEGIQAERQAAYVAEIVTAALEQYDEDGESDIDRTELSESQWSRIADADLDGNESLSQDELTQHVAAQVADRADAGQRHVVGFRRHHSGIRFGRR